MTTPSADNGQWIQPLSGTYIGLDRAGVLRQVLGVRALEPSHPAVALHDMTWAHFIESYADPAAYHGLHWGWQAIIEGCVARPYWPAMLPFAQGWVASIRPVENDPRITAVVHVRRDRAAQISATLEAIAQHTLDRAAQVGQQLLAGTAGPMTDMQVNHARGIAQSIIHTRLLLEQLDAEIFSLAGSAPAPYSISSLFAFQKHDFVDRRIVTHRLGLEHHWSSEQVYCQPGLRAVVQQALHTLFQRINEETSIRLEDHLADAGQACQVQIQYRSRDPELRVSERVLPLTLSDAQEMGTTRHINRLVTTIDAPLRAINGRAWAEPAPSQLDAASIVMLLPRWIPPVPR